MKKISIVFFLVYSLKGDFPGFFNAHIGPKKITKELKEFALSYEKNKANINKEFDNKIPKIIHQIWIGPNPLPEKFKWMIESWKKFHPNWKYKLWTNEDLKNFNLINKTAFDSSKNWGQKSDILRYEILNKLGGVYVDIDFECLKNFDILHDSFEFYCGLLCETDHIANGIIGTIANHPVIRDCIEQIRILKKFNNNNHDIIDATGPYFFTKKVLNFLLKNDNNKLIVLPSSFFFPFPATLRRDYWKNLIPRQKILNYIKSETFAIHYWANSWQ